MSSKLTDKAENGDSQLPFEVRKQQMETNSIWRTGGFVYLPRAILADNVRGCKNYQ